MYLPRGVRSRLRLGDRDNASENGYRLPGMDSAVSATDQLFARFELLRQAWPKKGWSWDYRLNCVASSFHVDVTRDCEKALLSVFPEVYDHRTISKAPEHIQDLAEEIGGVRADQRIFTVTSNARL